MIRSGHDLERDAILGLNYAHDIADLDDPEASLLYLLCTEDRWKLILTYEGEANRFRFCIHEKKVSRIGMHFEKVV